MKYMLEQASLNYLKKLLDNDKYYTEDLEDTYVHLKCAVDERNKLQQENKELKEQLELKSGMNIAIQNIKFDERLKQQTELIEKIKLYIKTQITIIQLQPSENKEIDDYIISILNTILNLIKEYENE